MSYLKQCECCHKKINTDDIFISRCDEKLLKHLSCFNEEQTQKEKLRMDVEIINRMEKKRNFEKELKALTEKYDMILLLDDCRSSNFNYLPKKLDVNYIDDSRKK